MKYIQELVLEDMPEDARKLIPELGTLNFIKEGRNIVMYGNPGTGKTHTAIGLGIKACMEGYSVLDPDKGSQELQDAAAAGSKVQEI